MDHLAILQVVIPLMAAPLCFLMSGSRAMWLFTLITCALAFVISLALTMQVQTTGTISYSLGGWQAPIGVEYRIDILSAYLLLIISGLAFSIMLAARQSIEQELSKSKQVYFYTLYLLCLAGMLGICATGDVFNLFIFIEIAALSSYGLIALGQDRRALTASLNYLLVGTLGATFILIGIGLLYMTTGTLNMQDLSQRLTQVNGLNTVVTALAFISVGVCLKLALFPLHWWLPNAYAFAPSMVSAFFAATSTKVAIYVLLRFIFSIFGFEFTFSTIPLQNILLLLGVAGVVAASTIAIYQKNLKQLLAYSSVAQVGYMMLALGIKSPNGLLGTLLHLFNHALMKGALFLALAAVMLRVGRVQIDALAGLGRQMPWTMSAFVIGGLSLIGLPLTVGFLSKWYMLSASLESGMWWLTFVILFGSLLTAIYVWRIVETAYFKPSTGSVRVKEAPTSLLIPLWILTLANLYFGIDSRLSISLSQSAVNMLFGVSL